MIVLTIKILPPWYSVWTYGIRYCVALIDLWGLQGYKFIDRSLYSVRNH